MKNKIRNLVLSIMVLVLAFSLTGNWFLLNRNHHLNKKIDTLAEKAQAYDEIEEDYIKYFDLYDKCEFDLNGTMETLEVITKENATLKAEIENLKKNR